jgi:hypothetical protein
MGGPSKKCEDCGQKQANYGMDQPAGKPKTKRWCGACSKAHQGAIYLYGRQCEVCKKDWPIFGIPNDPQKRRRWCAECAKSVRGAVDIHSKTCEDCKTKQPHFGMPGEKGRWCGNCAKQHLGSVSMYAKLCRDCGEKHASFGMPEEGKKLWCSECAKSHDRSTGIRIKCEDCNKGTPSYGLPGAGEKARWCKLCADKSHPKAANIVSKRCEDCGVKSAGFSLQGERKRRWCGACAKSHPGTVPHGKLCDDCNQKVPVWGLRTEQKKRWCGDCAPSTLVFLARRPAELVQKDKKDAANNAKSLTERGYVGAADKTIGWAQLRDEIRELRKEVRRLKLRDERTTRQLALAKAKKKAPLHRAGAITPWNKGKVARNQKNVQDKPRLGRPPKAQHPPKKRPRQGGPFAARKAKLAKPGSEGEGEIPMAKVKPGEDGIPTAAASPKAGSPKVASPKVVAPSSPTVRRSTRK